MDPAAIVTGRAVLRENRRKEGMLQGMNQTCRSFIMAHHKSKKGKNKQGVDSQT